MTLLILPSEALRQPRGRLSAAQRILGAKRSRLGTSEAAFLRPLGLGVSAGRSDSRISVDLSSHLHACGFLLVAASAVTRRGGRGHPSPERRRCGRGRPGMTRLLWAVNSCVVFFHSPCRLVFLWFAQSFLSLFHSFFFVFPEKSLVLDAGALPRLILTVVCLFYDIFLHLLHFCFMSWQIFQVIPSNTAIEVLISMILFFISKSLFIVSLSLFYNILHGTMSSQFSSWR